MTAFEQNCREVIGLSELLSKQDFRACFVERFAARVKNLVDDLPNNPNRDILERLQLTLMVPLMVHLKKTSNSTDKCLLIECLTEVLGLTCVHHVDQFFHVYLLAFHQIYKGGNLPYRPSEELQMAVLECCSFLLQHSTESVLKRVYSEEFAKQFSMGVSVSVAVVKEEKSIKLRLAALDFLLTASKYETNPELRSKIYDNVADLFRLYLPGILAPLLEVILRDETQHHMITVKALSCWGHVLCLVFKDSSESECLSESEIMKQWLEKQKDPQEEIGDVREGLKEKKRTKAWLESAAVALHPLVLKISDVRKHSNPKCRLELTRIMVHLLRNCMRNLKNCLPTIIDTLVSGGSDEDATVSQLAEEALNIFEAECSKRSVPIFVPAIEENLYSVVNKLPRVILSGNEPMILSFLKSFSGYIKILGRLKRLEQLISLSSTLKKLVFVIQLACELESYPEISNKDFHIWEISENEVASQNWWKPWKRFRHFGDDAIQRQLEEICHSLGKFGRSEEIFDFLLSNCTRECPYRKELLLITNEVLSGSEGLPDHIVKHLIQFYLDPQNLYPPLEVNRSDCFSLREAQWNIMVVALAMEGIGKLAKSVGNRFQDYLFESLYCVLEQMGSSFAIIRDAATKSAVQIADACGLNGDIRFLIQKNVDYLIFHLTLKLRRNERSVFDVVTVLMKNSPFETLPNIEEIVNRVLKSSEDNVDSPQTTSYLRLFHTFVFCVNKWTKRIDSKTESRPKTPRLSPAKSGGLDLLKKYLEELQGENLEDLPEEQKEGEEVAFPQEPEKPQLPRHLKLIVSVANHSLHFLASKDADKKLIVLEILDESVRALADWEDDLLPLVHKIWSPLVMRFDQMRDPLLINRSFTLLCTLSHTSKDFIRSRTLKNVLPALETFIQKEASKSQFKDSSSGYFFTQAFKLQRELLENLGKLATSLKLFERHRDLVAECALPYLSSQQPQVLQEKCRILFEDLGSYDPYLVWFKVHSLTENPEYAKNAAAVLSSVQSGQN